MITGDRVAQMRESRCHRRRPRNRVPTEVQTGIAPRDWASLGLVRSRLSEQSAFGRGHAVQGVFGAHDRTVATGLWLGCLPIEQGHGEDQVDPRLKPRLTAESIEGE